MDKALETDMLPRNPIAVQFLTAETLQIPERVKQKSNVNY